jgi:hypothetical protein
MDLKESLKQITHLATRLAPDGWEYVNSYNFLHYNEMTFIPDLKKNKANRILTNVPSIKETISKLSDYVDTIITTDVSSLTSEFDVDLYASKVSPDAFEKTHIMAMTDLQDEVNSAWVDFYASVLSGSWNFEEDVSDKFVSQINNIKEIAKKLEQQYVALNKFLLFNYTLTNQLGISLLHEDDRLYLVKAINDYKENNKPDITVFKNLCDSYQEANNKLLLDIKSEVTKIEPSTFITNADLFIDTIQKTTDTSSVEGFLIEKMLTDNSVYTSIDFTAAQKINKVVFFDDASIAYKRDGQYHTFKDTESLKAFISDLHNDALAYLLRKKPKTISFFQDKLREDVSYNNSITAAISFLDNYSVLKQYNVDLNAWKDKTFESIDDDINHIVNKNKIKQFAFSILSAKYKHLFNDITEPHFKALYDNNVTTSQLQTFVGKKLAALDSNEDVISMLSGILNHVDGFTQEALSEKLNALGINKIHDANNVVTFEVKSYKQCESLGSTSWCIVRDQEYYDQYVSDRRNIQYIMYDFNKASTDINSMIGFTVDKSGSIYAEHLKNDDAISSYDKSDELAHIQTNTIYTNRKQHRLSEEKLFEMEESLNFRDVEKVTKPLKMRNI